MNTSNIKRYAPKARTAFIAAMTKRAALFGIRESSIPSMGIEPLEQKGDLALVGDRPFPASIIRARTALVKKVEQIGFASAMEQAAYSWFNRLCAIRFMELKGYLDHGRRVLSHPDQPSGFQILDDCLDIKLDGLDQQRIAELKLDGTKDEELYRELLLTQCHALHTAMPFLFEAVDDATELLLPDNLTKTDSLIRELVSSIPEEDWQDVEIIGWLYQFYISEKKDQIIGKVVKSEDIPAATQLFTPNWIVQYLVQNSVGRQWLQTYPDSPLKAKMPYYIEPAEQTSEVQAQLAAITPDSIDPLTIKFLDPACGSGHILVEAYKMLKEIYTERGHRSRDIPQLILEHNLFGLDIDDRAGQLAGFALMMLAREDDRRIFSRIAENGFKLNVLSLQESRHLDVAALWQALNLNSDWQRGQSQSLFDGEQSDLSAAQADNRYQMLKTTLARFIQAKTFGSLIEVPAEDAERLGELLVLLRQLAKDGDSMQRPAAQQLVPVVHQGWILAQRYDAVVANPPYMGKRGMNKDIKIFAEKLYKNSKSDLFSLFMERGFLLCKKYGVNAQVNMQAWMFLSSFELLRSYLIKSKTILSLVQLGSKAFTHISGDVVQTCAWVISNTLTKSFSATYIDATKGAEDEKSEKIKYSEPCKCKQEDFLEIPGTPIAYGISERIKEIFHSSKRLEDYATPRQGLSTSDNNRFLRFWHEVELTKIGFGMATRDAAQESRKKWFPYNKGGGYKKWYGNLDYVINWENDGTELRAWADYLNSVGTSMGRLVSQEYYFNESVTWSKIASNRTSFRYLPEGFIFDAQGMSIFSKDKKFLDEVLLLLNSNIFDSFMGTLSPTLSNESGQIKKTPTIRRLDNCSTLHDDIVSISIDDYNSYETSYGFKFFGAGGSSKKTIRDSFSLYLREWDRRIEELRSLEQENNRRLISLYGLHGEAHEEVEINEVTLYRNLQFVYGNDIDEDKKSNLEFYGLSTELISYFVGCIMGRYSLDREGLVYALAGNQGFAMLVAEGAYQTFPADNDGILPLTDQEWFTDDATNRFREFVRTVWGEEHLQENLDFVAESLCFYAIKSKRGESALGTIRRYLSTQFYKDHLKTYKKRPLYWLFSSGKHKAFECLVYLHRYNEGTLARMRTEYIIPLTAKLNTYASKLATDIENETVTSEKKRLEKELATLHNQQAELATFDEKLRHYADQRIRLDLDDGVKVNYGKFGDLLAEVKAVTGDKGD